MHQTLIQIHFISHHSRVIHFIFIQYEHRDLQISGPSPRWRLRRYADGIRSSALRGRPRGKPLSPSLQYTFKLTRMRTIAGAPCIEYLVATLDASSPTTRPWKGRNLLYEYKVRPPSPINAINYTPLSLQQKSHSLNYIPCRSLKNPFI